MSKTKGSSENTTEHNYKINRRYFAVDDIPDEVLNHGRDRRVIIRFRNREDMEEFERLSGLEITGKPPKDPDEYEKWFNTRGSQNYYSRVRVTSSKNSLEEICG